LLSQYSGIRVGKPLGLPPDFPEIPADIRAYGEQQRAQLSPEQRKEVILRHFETGQRAFEQERYRAAIPEFLRAIVLMTEDVAGANVFYNLAQSYANLDQMEAYRAAMNFYLQMVPDDPDAYFSLAYAALLDEDFEECIRLSKLGRERVRDRHPKGLLNLARAYAHLGRYPESIRTLEEAIRLAPNWSEAYQNLGATYEDLGDLERAKEYYRRASEVDPGNLSARDQLERLEKGIVILGGPPPPRWSKE